MRLPIYCTVPSIVTSILGGLFTPIDRQSTLLLTSVDQQSRMFLNNIWSLDFLEFIKLMPVLILIDLWYHSTDDNITNNLGRDISSSALNLTFKLWTVPRQR